MWRRSGAFFVSRPNLDLGIEEFPDSYGLKIFFCSGNKCLTSTPPPSTLGHVGYSLFSKVSPSAEKIY